MSVLVTGSNIPRVERENALPVEVITREQIERTNLQTAAQLVNTITASMSFLGFTEALGLRATPGLAAASLRGLGRSSTLVLINGRRFANFALSPGGGGDLNAIPLSAVERVEVLKDGASAIYGSDAIAGVINFILRSEYDGANVSAQYTSPEHTGGYAKRLTAWAGVGNLATREFNAYVNVDYQKYGGIQARDRAFAARSVSESNSFPANVDLGLDFGSRNPTGDPANLYQTPPCFPPNSSVAGHSFECRWFGDGSVSIVNSSEKLNVVASLVWQFARDQQLFVYSTWSRNQFGFTAWPAAVTFPLPPTSAYYPHEFASTFGMDGVDLRTLWRAQELGAQLTEPTTEQWNAVAGMQGVVNGWNYSGAVNYSRNKVDTRYANGFVSRAVLLPLLTTVVNPFGPNTSDVIERTSAARVDRVLRTGTSTIESFDFDAWKDVLSVPAGPLTFAVGFDIIRERLSQDADPLLAPPVADVAGASAFQSFTGSRSNWALFGEARIPMLPSLDANAAVRYDHYSDFGGTTNPKVSLRWQPRPELALRASAGTGFLAPALTALYTPLGFFQSGPVDDPLRCKRVQEDCLARYNTMIIGNPALRPATSKQMSAGAVWAPLNGLSMAADYVSIWLTNQVQTSMPLEILKYCPDGVTGPTCHLIHRWPTDYPGLPGPIRQLDQLLTNRDKTKVSAVDVSVAYVAPMQRWGQLALNFTGTYNIEYLQQQVDGNYVDLVGTSGLGVVPRWRHYLVLNWTKGPWSATLSDIYQTGVHDQFPAVQPRKTGDYDAWDLGLSYTGFRNWNVSAGIKNVFDRDPPYSNQIRNPLQAGYDPTYADPHGRLYWVALSYAFK